MIDLFDLCECLSMLQGASSIIECYVVHIGYFIPLLISELWSIPLVVSLVDKGFLFLSGPYQPIICIVVDIIEVAFVGLHVSEPGYSSSSQF